MTTLNAGNSTTLNIASPPAELREHNTKEWWAANKARYDENVRGPFEALAA